MNITRAIFYSSFVLFVFGHFYLGLIGVSKVVEGDYFSSGVIMTSEGAVLRSSQRLYSDGENLFGYYQVGDQKVEQKLSRVFNFGGGALYEQKLGGNHVLNEFKDQDLAFNASYSSSPFARFTLSFIESTPSVCFFIYELSSVHCYSAKRMFPVRQR